MQYNELEVTTVQLKGSVLPRNIEYWGAEMTDSQVNRDETRVMTHELGRDVDLNVRDLLQPGTELDISVTSGWVIRTIPSYVVHVVDEALYLPVPEPRDLSVVLSSSNSLTLHIKPDNARYKATTQVLGYTKRGPLRLVVALPKVWEKEDRRQHARVPVLIHPEECWAYFSQSTGWLRISPTIVNIGAGGIKLQHHQLLTKGATLKMQFGLPDGYGPIQVEGRVLHSQMSRVTDFAHVYWMGVQFTLITTQDREAIIRYIQEQERCDLP